MGKNDSSKMKIELCKLSMPGLFNCCCVGYNLENGGSVDYNLVCISKRTIDHLHQNHLINQNWGY